MNKHSWTSAVALVLVTLLAVPRSGSAQHVTTAEDIWRAFAEKIEPGKTLKVRLVSGKRMKATLLQVSAEAITVQPKTRIPVPPQHVPFTDIASLEIDTGKGTNLAKAVAIGAVTGAGAFLGLLMMAFAVWGD